MFWVHDFHTSSSAKTTARCGKVTHGALYLAYRPRRAANTSLRSYDVIINLLLGFVFRCGRENTRPKLANKFLVKTPWSGIPSRQMVITCLVGASPRPAVADQNAMRLEIHLDRITPAIDPDRQPADLP